MSRLSCLALALGLAVALPTAAPAAAPSARRPEMVDTERAEFRRAILLVRAIVEHLKSPRFCGPPAEAEAAERTLKYLEWAYAHHMPFPFNRAKPGR